MHNYCVNISKGYCFFCANVEICIDLYHQERYSPYLKSVLRFWRFSLPNSCVSRHERERASAFGMPWIISCTSAAMKSEALNFAELLQHQICSIK